MDCIQGNTVTLAHGLCSWEDWEDSMAEWKAEHILAAIDVGTNSVHMVVVRIEPYLPSFSIVPEVPTNLMVSSGLRWLRMSSTGRSKTPRR